MIFLRITLMKCYKLKCKIIARTSRAILLNDFQGNDEWLPFSQIAKFNDNGKSINCFASCWILDQKDLNHSKKEYWVTDNGYASSFVPRLKPVENIEIPNELKD